MTPPSFEPWLSRVRMARTWAAGAAFLAVSWLAYGSGLNVDDALLRGLAAAVACYFVAWATALWVCGELYHAQIASMRTRLEERERARQQQIERLYEQRLESLNDSLGVPSGIETSPMDAGAPSRQRAA